jgi:hypothetical protein
VRDDDDSLAGMELGDPPDGSEHALAVRVLRLADVLDAIALRPGEALPVAPVALTQIWVGDDGEAELLGEDLRRLVRAGKVARIYRVDVLAREPAGERLRLSAPVLVERPVGVTLEPPLGVPVGLAVSYEEQRGQTI